jgi:hypothetical protein
MFRTVPLPIIRSFSLCTQQWYMSYRFVDNFRAAAGSGWNCRSILILLLLESCLQTCMTYTIAVCTVRNSWWLAEELSETCRFPFQNKCEKSVHLVGFIIKNINCFIQCTAHGTRLKLKITDIRLTSVYSKTLVLTFNMLLLLMKAVQRNTETWSIKYFSTS